MIKSLAISVCALLLVACDSNGTVQVEPPSVDPVVGAAIEHPCTADFAFQAELNGTEDDRKLTSELVAERTVITEQYWYSALQMIVYFSYEENGGWCNSWSESGVNWVN